LQTVIIRYGEIGTKSRQTRKRFEELLAKNIRKILEKHKIDSNDKNVHARLLVDIEEDYLERAVELLKKVPGISTFSPAVKCELDIESIVRTAKELVKKELENHTHTKTENITFGVRTQRIHKQFPMNSIEVNRFVGEKIINEFGLKVDLKNPDIPVDIEILRDSCYIFTKRIDGVGGIPVGTQGKVLVLLSDGIDSPVAAYLMIKRGCNVVLLHLKTSEEGAKKTEKIVEILSDYDCDAKYIVKDFKEELAKIKKNLIEIDKEKYTCVFCKKSMLRIGEKFAERLKCDAIVNGDNLGQVASQTLKNLRVISHGITYPILRPLVGFDKNEIIEIAKKIGTYEISTSKEVKCFAVPKYPITTARLEDVETIDKKLSEMNEEKE